MKNLFTIGALIGAVAFLFFFFGKMTKKGEKPEAPAKPSPVTASPQSPVPEIAVGPAPDSRNQDVQGKQQKVAGFARQVGLKSLPFTKKNENWVVKIRFTSTRKKCEAGDMDLIRVDQKRRRIANLAVSLDDLATQKNLFYQKVTLASLSGSTVLLRWKADKEPRSLGLALCSDAKERKSCTAAKIEDINQILDRKAAPNNGDRIYYFQYLQEGEQLALLDSSRGQARNEKLLNQLLTMQSVSSKDADQISTMVSGANLMIGSMTARVNKEGLIIDLPHNDPACPLPHLQF